MYVKCTSHTTVPFTHSLVTLTGRVGVSITITSLTDMLAFALGATSSLPAVTNFCGFAAWGILIDYLLQVVVVVVMVMVVVVMRVVAVMRVVVMVMMRVVVVMMVVMSVVVVMRVVVVTVMLMLMAIVMLMLMAIVMLMLMARRGIVSLPLSFTP